MDREKLSKKHIVGLVTVIIVLVITPCLYRIYDYRVYSVPFIELLLNGKQYHGRYVRVIGVLSFGYEGDSLYYTYEHYSNWLDDALGIVFDGDVLSGDGLDKLEGKYVVVEGKYNDRNHGHLGVLTGTIEKARLFLDEWPVPQ